MTLSEIRAKARTDLTGKWGKAVLMILAFGLIEFVIGFIIGLFEEVAVVNIVLSIVDLIITLPLSYGLVVSFIRLKREEPVGYFDFLTIAFSNIGRVWRVYGNIILKVLPAFIVLVIAYIVLISSMVGLMTGGILGASSAVSGFSGIGIVAIIAIIASLIYLIPKALLYTLSYVVMYDHEQMTAKQVVEESARLMQGNRWRFICLELSFFGWIILISVLTAIFAFVPFLNIIGIIAMYVALLFLSPYMQIAMIEFYEMLKGNHSEDKDKKEDSSEEKKPIENSPEPKEEDQGPIQNKE